ncbi:MAG: hypothetical protein A2901_03485 [Elusimicrobia bacterium RIFCSPLOWO2_01_FULL_54_10]|nr:MAG: hypothetical protein A2901_03485 [Elusimicrobia bacterium RIFCSPLOWO2_01_FULL_54_10]
MNRNSLTTALVVLYGACLGVGLFRILAAPSHKPSPEQPSALLHIKKLETQPAVAIVPIYGAISVGQDSPFQANSADRLAKRLKALSERPNVKAVVLRINSPGGSVGAVQEIYDEINRLKAAGKKVVVSMGDVAASGGYYIAAPADKIFANPGTITGSIGVIFQLSNVQDLFKKIGVKIEPVKSSKHKDIGSPFRSQSAEEMKILQSIIDDAYGQFVQAIVDGRKMERAKVVELADGRIYSGAQAKSRGLVDELGNLEAAIAKAGELAGIKGKPRVFYDEDPWGKFFSSFSQSSASRIFASAGDKLGLRLAYLWEYD